MCLPLRPKPHGLLVATAAASSHGDFEAFVAVAAAAAAGALSGRCPPVPLPKLNHPPPHRLLHCSRRQAPSLLPYAPRPPHLPQPLPQTITLNPTRCFSSESEPEPESEQEPDPARSVSGSEESEAVDRIHGIISDVFAVGDRNMEAVLDNSGIVLTGDIVIAVLERFRHAHRPAHRFFRWAASSQPGYSHTPETYCKMLAVLGKTRQFESMVSLLEEMGKMGFLSMDAFKIAIKSFAAAREMKKAMGVFALMKRYNFSANLDACNCLIEALAKAKLGREAHQLFDKMRGEYTPDLRTYTVLLLGWCKIKNLVEAGKVWNEMLDKGVRPDVVAHNTMLEGLLCGQRRPEAVKLFELMKAKGPAPNVWTYTMLIQDHCKRGKMDSAVQCFQEMQAAGCEPDAATYTCLIVGFGNAQQIDKVSALLREMKEKGCPPDGRTYNALIRLMTNRSMPDDAVRIYKKMVKNGFEPTIHTYNMMMKSYFHGGKNYEMGCAVWDEMARKGICPDVNSYTVFIGGHIRHGRPVEAYKYIEEMANKGMKAPQIDYNKFAADFSRAGKPDVLYELAQKMKFSGKFEVSNVFHGWAERMKNRVKKMVPNQIGSRIF